MKTLQNRSFLSKFARYLLVGLSAMVLLAGSQQMILGGLRGSSFVLADEENLNEVGPLNPGEPLFTEPISQEEPINPGEPLFTEPLPPAPQPPAPQPPAPQPEVQPVVPVQCTCDSNTASRLCPFQKFGDSCGNVDVCPGTKDCSAPAPAQAPAQVTAYSCPNKPSYCIGNQTYQCTGGYYNPSNRDADTDGCVRTCNPVAGNPLNCGVVVVAQCIPNISQQNVCIACNISRRVSLDSCGNQTILIGSQFDSGCGNLCVVTTPPVVCPPGTTLVNGVCQLPTGAPAPGNTVTQSPTITVSPTITANPTNTVNVTQQTPPAITILTARAADNVGVGTTVTTVTTGQVLGVKELPKTGLPALAWSVLAFIPLGSRMRRFSSVKGELENKPTYIWEERQYKQEI